MSSENNSKSTENIQREYVVLPLCDYVNLKHLAEVKPVTVKGDDILFLSALISEISPMCECDLSIINGTVFLKQCLDGSEINSAFDLKLCEKYYYRVNAFISEVL